MWKEHAIRFYFSEPAWCVGFLVCDSWFVILGLCLLGWAGFFIASLFLEKLLIFSIFYISSLTSYLLSLSKNIFVSWKMFFKVLALALVAAALAAPSAEYIRLHEAMHMRDLNPRHLAIIESVNSNPKST